MAEIQMIYREGYCDLRYVNPIVADGNYCEQCHTCSGEDLGCPEFNDGRRPGEIRIPFGDCKNAKFETRYKGVTVKNYEIEPFIDDYNRHLDCMLVTIGKKQYECTKVILNGECIYSLEDEA